ncbi:double-CXXCG motif protein [Pyxidicoccus trucidator]|uniref:double-CXXCG motif protein n=1 Tax=Pyxidicoccus trucidator TaxID=2709662 RepID=UPI001F07173D|nr:double-CXXCG motif protein [Pyxidicoccus trucidator]
MASEALSNPMRFFVLNKLREGEHDTEFSRTSSNMGPALRCPQCGNTVGALSWEPPYQGDLEFYGQAFGDLLKGPSGLLITERFAEDFKAEGLTGLSGFHPVEIKWVRRKGRGSKPGPPPAYLYVTLAYGHAALDMERSRILSKKPMVCSWCRYVGPDAIDGLALEEGTWNGEDVFRPRGMWGAVLVSERFKRFAGKHAMSHMAMIPIENYIKDPLGLLPRAET